MRLAQAEKTASALLKRLLEETHKGGEAQVVLTMEEQVAITVLCKFAGRLLAAKSSVRALAMTIFGRDELNQEELFGGEPPKEEGT